MSGLFEEGREERRRVDDVSRGDGFGFPGSVCTDWRGDGFQIPVSVRSPQRGFTLIEVIIAFALLALALSLLLGTLSGAAKQVRVAADGGRAALHAQSLLDQTGVGEPLQPGHREGDFEDGRYRWTMEITPYVDPVPNMQAGIDPNAPQLLQLVLMVQWKDGGPRNRLRLQSLRLTAADVSQPMVIP